VGEDAAEGAVDGEHGRDVHLVGLDPLHEERAAVHARRHRLVELEGEQAGDAGAVRVRGLGEYDVVPARGGEEHLAGVPDLDVHARVVEHVVVH
jgi:hypothetical protein